MLTKNEFKLFKKEIEEIFLERNMTSEFCKKCIDIIFYHLAFKYVEG
jgi:hypothetical protein